MSEAITRLNAALEGRYRIGSELGEGGMATVYLAEDIKHERQVALKVLKPELAAVVGAERFLAEIKTTANLQHPHILRATNGSLAPVWFAERPGLVAGGAHL
ncbi:MAG: protein kinase [Gemmatimonadetes bacterium]|nr:protein kinase [Gemmatimonadota bacterium]